MSARKQGALLGDTPNRDYSTKLRLFNKFASPELRCAVEDLHLSAGMRILDAGCGTGGAVDLLSEKVAPSGLVWGIDLSEPHLRVARIGIGSNTALAQADILKPPFVQHAFDLVWSVNTLNHLTDPKDGISALRKLVRPQGRIAVGQSSLLPDMYFAWDARLERITNEAVRRYYRDKYHLTERDLTAVRSIVGSLRAGGLTKVRAKTYMIERVSPTNADDETYLLDVIFRGTFGEKLRPYLSADDMAELAALCDPAHPGYALRRPDFHFLQTFTVVIGEVTTH